MKRENPERCTVEDEGKSLLGALLDQLSSPIYILRRGGGSGTDGGESYRRCPPKIFLEKAPEKPNL